MDAWAWGAIAGLLVVVIGIAIWWYLRDDGDDRRPASRYAPRLPDDEGDADAAPLDAEAAADPAIPTGRALVRELYAAAVTPAPVADPMPADEAAAAHAAIAAACANLLSRTQFQARHMPRRPQLLPKLMRAINDPDISLEQIARIVSEDPALSANLLRIANSPFYRIQEKPVESLMRAATLLGLDGLRPVIAAALVQPVMQTGDGPLGRLPGVIWEHTQLAADVAAGMIRAGRGQEDAFAAQMVGLLHGLGAIVVAQVLRDSYTLHAHLPPDPRTVARVLDEQTAPMAHRIAVVWELSDRIGVALEAQRAEAMPTDPLGRALRAGRIAAALALLAREGRFGRDEGLEMLEAWAASRGVNADFAGMWDRLLA